MFNQIRAVTDVVGDHLVRGSGRIASGPCTGTAESLVAELTRRESEVMSLIVTGAVRRNQLDEVRNALQAVRLLKKFRFGGVAAQRKKDALEGFAKRNSEALLPLPPSFHREVLLAEMARVLEKALPPPTDGRFNLSMVLRRTDWASYVDHEKFFLSHDFNPDGIDCCPGFNIPPKSGLEWVKSMELPWGPRFGTGAVEEGMNLPFLRRWEVVDGRSSVVEAIRSGDLDRMQREFSLLSTSRASAVAKEMFKDRLITIEPFLNTFAQHAVRRMIYDSIHQGQLRWTAMDVMYLEDAQKINGRYALAGSRDSTVATIDMKDASDWIRAWQVRWVMPRWLQPYLDVCRSTHCMVDGVSKELGMYAGMGNATTFVVESLMFWAASVAAVRLNGRRDYIVSVYGDDVVLDDPSVPLVREAFELLGWHLNEGKSFWGRCPFRESCGTWAWNGHVITPARFDGYDLSTPGGLSGYREAISHLLDSGNGLGIILADRLTKACLHQVPVSSLDIPGSTVVFDKYGMWRNNHSRINTRINRDTQQLQAKVVVTQAVVVEVPADRIGYLYGSLSGQIRTTVKRKNGLVVGHAIRVPVPHRYSEKKDWINCVTPVGLRTNLKPRLGSAK